jgi:hypothetical protein
MTWNSIWLLALLKIPIAGMVGVVWWLIRHSDEPVVSSAEEDGGSPDRRAGRHPRPPLPRTPRRGPHHGAPAPAPSRVRARHGGGHCGDAADAVRSE